MSRSAAQARVGNVGGGSLVYKLEIGVRQWSAHLESDKGKGVDNAADGDKRTSLLLRSSTSNETAETGDRTNPFIENDGDRKPW
jgi:hypothetical protein